MAIRVRTYVFEKSGQLKRVPRRVADSLVFGHDAIPEYASSRQRVAQVVVEMENGRPVRILSAEGVFWTFDAVGRIDKDIQRAAWGAMSFAWGLNEPAHDKIVDLRPELKRKAWRKEHRWDITAEDLNRIAADLWPNLADAPEVKTVKGAAPRQPPLTHDAKRALADIEGKLGGISHALEDLAEPALKGLAFEARRMARAYPLDSAALWAGIADEADRQREIKARRRTGRGRWYAILTVWREDGPHRMSTIDEIEVLCPTRDAAVESAKRLLAENASRFDTDIRIEAEVRSELEHSPSGDEERHEDGSENADVGT